MRNFGNRDQQAPARVLASLDGFTINRIIEIPGVLAIDRHQRHITQIDPALLVLVAYLVTPPVGIVEHLLRKFIRQAIVVYRDIDFHARCHMIAEDIDDPAIPAMGEFIGTNQAFPDGCNAGFAEWVDPGQIRLRVIERGAGETLACGSGACAAVAILRRSGHVRETVDVQLPGGRLVIKWRGNDQPMIMKGPAEHVFRGTMNE